nr:hypothetical protein [uncultured Fluviicola sp.]
MNKIFYFAVGLFTLVSCQKSQTCTCSDGYTFTVKASKKTAADTCEKYSDEKIDCKIN